MATGAGALSILLAGGNRPPQPFANMLATLGPGESPEAPEAGALAGADRSRNEDDLQDELPKGALASGKPKNKNQTIADELLNFGGGPLSEAASIRDAQRAATQEKRDALQRAKANIKDLDKLMPDPGSSWARAAPTRTGSFAEYLSNVAAARQEVMDKRREMAIAQAQAMQNLDLAGADLSWRQAEAEAQGEDRRIKIAEQFASQARLEDQERERLAERADEAATRKKYYEELDADRDAAREQREAEAKAARESREAIAKENREAREAADNRVTWQAGPGPDPNDPTKRVQGMWQLPSKAGEKPVFHAEGTLQRTPAGGGVGGNSVFQQKYGAFYDYFKKRGLSDTDAQGQALERASGKAPMSAADRRQFAIKQAMEESKQEFYTPEERRARTDQIEEELKKVDLPGAVPPPAAPAPAAAAPNQGKSSIPAGAPTATDAKGNKVYFDGKQWVPVK